jgi:hypothetical protein
MIQAGHVACIEGGGGTKNTYRILLGKPKTKYLKDLGVDGKISLN